MGELLTPTHLIVVLVLALVLFGPRKLPELGKGLGEGLRAGTGQAGYPCTEAGDYVRSQVRSIRVRPRSSLDRHEDDSA
jgi:TatA/E family protein of Tat protein translocase